MRLPKVVPTGLILATLAFGLVSPFFGTANAAQLQNTSLTVSRTNPGELSDHLFGFSYPNTETVGSVAFEYCANTAILDTACTPPPNLNVEAANLSFQSGETGFSIHSNTTANRLVISRPAASGGPGPAQYLFAGVQNHTTESDTVYVRIYVYPTVDGTGPHTDAAAAAFSTSTSLTVGLYVPPFLIFCVGITVAIDCSSAEGTRIALGELQTSSVATATSQYSGATNDFTGYSVSVHGTTMTSGNNVIPAIDSPDSSRPGNSQFGINLRDNNVPDVGQNESGPGTSVAAVDYSLVDTFKFASSDLLSLAGTSSNYDRFTVSYIVNISDDQPAGVYTTTVTYIAVASF